MDWFRSWHGAPTDPKWLVIARRAGVAPGMASAVAWALMDHASQHEDRGSVAGFDTETYAVFSGFAEEDVVAIIEAMRSKGLIENDRLSAWERRQPKSDNTSTDRVRAWRERNRTETPETGETQDPEDETDCNTAPPAETGCNNCNALHPLHALHETGCNDETPCNAQNRTEQNREEQNREDPGTGKESRTPSVFPGTTSPGPGGPEPGSAQTNTGSPQPVDPLTQCIEYLKAPKANKAGAVGRLYEIRFGNRYPPDHGRLGALAKQLSGGFVALAELIWRSSMPEGDPHDYLAGCVKGAPARKGGKGGSNGNFGIAGRGDDRRAPEPTAADLEAWERFQAELGAKEAAASG